MTLARRIALDKPRVQPFAQALLLLASLIVAAVLYAIEPARATSGLWLGIAVIAAGTVVMVIVYRRPPTRGTAWLALIPIIDLLAIVLIRDAATGALPAAGMLSIFPIGWLAYAFSVPAIIIALSFTVFIAGSQIFLSGNLPDSTREWIPVVALPVLLSLYATATYFISWDSRVQRTRLIAAQDTITDALRTSGRDYATLKTIVDTTPDAVVVFDLDGEPLLSNLAAARFAAHAQIPIAVGGFVSGLVYKDDALTPLPLRRELLPEMIEGRFTRPIRVWIGPPGDQIALSFLAKPVVENGSPVAVVVVAHDITELVHAVDVRDRFLDEVGHELRTPLTVILGNVDLTIDDVDGRPRERLVAIQRSAERLLAMVQRLLDAGRSAVESPGGVSEVTAVISVVVEGLRPDAERREVAIRHTKTEAVHVEVDTKALSDIVTELVRNAIHVSPAGSSVVITTQVQGGDVRVEVLDQGPGMTPDEIRRAFDRFYRTERSRRDATPGAGLGLALAANLAAANSARITLEPHGEGFRANLHMVAATRRRSGSPEA